MGGASLTFNGSSSDVNYGDVTMMDGATTASFVGWVNTNDATVVQRIISKWTGSDADAQYLVVIQATGALRAAVGQGNDPFSNRIIMDSNAGVITNNTWHHFACVWSGSNDMVIYIDGVDQTDTAVLSTTPTSIGNGTLDLTIGQGNTVSYVDGELSDIQMFKNKALTQAEVQELMYKPGSIMEDCVFYMDTRSTSYKDMTGTLSAGTPTDMSTSVDGPGVFFPNPITMS